jgi:hypothetical protein
VLNHLRMALWCVYFASSSSSRRRCYVQRVCWVKKKEEIYSPIMSDTCSLLYVISFFFLHLFIYFFFCYCWIMTSFSLLYKTKCLVSRKEKDESNIRKRLMNKGRTISQLNSSCSRREKKKRLNRVKLFMRHLRNSKKVWPSFRHHIIIYRPNIDFLI